MRARGKEINCPEGWQDTSDGKGFVRFTKEGLSITINRYDSDDEYSVEASYGMDALEHFYSTFRECLSVANGLAKTKFFGGWIEP